MDIFPPRRPGGPSHSLAGNTALHEAVLPPVLYPDILHLALQSCNGIYISAQAFDGEEAACWPQPSPTMFSEQLFQNY